MNRLVYTIVAILSKFYFILLWLLVGIYVRRVGVWPRMTSACYPSSARRAETGLLYNTRYKSMDELVASSSPFSSDLKHASITKARHSFISQADCLILKVYGLLFLAKSRYTPLCDLLWKVQHGRRDLSCAAGSDRSLISCLNPPAILARST